MKQKTAYEIGVRLVCSEMCTIVRHCCTAYRAIAPCARLDPIVADSPALVPGRAPQQWQPWTVTDGTPAAATSADRTAAPELEAQSRHENGRLAYIVDQDMPGAPCPVILLGAALWRILATKVLASPSEFTRSITA